MPHGISLKKQQKKRGEATLTRHRKRKRAMRLPKYQQAEQEYHEVYNDIIIEGKTNGQKLLIQTIYDNDIVFCVGPGGSGKTHISTSIGLKELLLGNYERLIISRPIVESGPGLGFLPGGQLEKVRPYMIPIYEEMEKHLPRNTVKSMIGNTVGKRIEIVPFEYMRGRNFHDCYIVSDEFQNADEEQIEMLLSRIGNNSKIVLGGDFRQTDLRRRNHISVSRMRYLSDNIDGVAFVELTESDIVRSRMVAELAKYWRLYNAEKADRSF